MSNDNETAKRRLALGIFIQKNASCKEIARILELPEMTIRKWRNDDKWVLEKQKRDNNRNAEALAKLKIDPVRKADDWLRAIERVRIKAMDLLKDHKTEAADLKTIAEVIERMAAFQKLIIDRFPTAADSTLVAFVERELANKPTSQGIRRT